MSLKAKFILLIMSIVFILCLSFAGLHYSELHGRAFTLDSNSAQKDLERGIETTLSYMTNLEKIVFDWGAWTDTFDYMSSKEESYITENYSTTAFHDNEWNLVYILDREKNVRWSKVIELNTNQDLEIVNFVEDLSKATSRIITDSETKLARSGIFISSAGPLLLASSPILRSEHSGENRGTLIIGRFIDREFIENLSGIARANIEIWPNTESSSSSKFSSILEYLNKSKEISVKEFTDGNLIVYNRLEDIFNESKLLMYIQAPQTHRHLVNHLMFDIYKIFFILIPVLIVGIMLFYKLSIYNKINELLEYGDKVSKNVHHKGPSNFNGSIEFLYIAKLLEEISENHDKQVESILKVNTEASIKNISRVILNDANIAITESIDIVSKIENSITNLPVIDLERTSAELTSGKVPENRLHELIRVIGVSSKHLREQQSHIQISISELKRAVASVVTNIKRHTTNYL